ncbi:MAG TPA: acetyl-CoA hydrolase/transferase C-terminal domain-containing protein [Dehalococcoidia bacterium]|nr:acetyl-CoA hydrolase/transferase C-terminal domain-containing protein [Dehalococcoidia bacterium]
MSDWQTYYQERLTTPAEAVKLVKDGDTVMVPIFPPALLVLALAQRREELRDVTIRLLAPAADPGWLRLPDETNFKIEFELFVGDFARFVMDEKRGAYLPNLFSLGMKAYDQQRPGVRLPDVLLCTVSKPNRAGFCHFGIHHWVQRSYARRCPIVIAQVDESLTPVHGDVYVHVSEIDHFVEFTPPPLDREQFDQVVSQVADPERQAGWRALADDLPNLQVLRGIRAVIPALHPNDVRTVLGMGEPVPEAEAIAGHLNTLINDGDTIQIGVGEPSRGIVRCGAFQGKKHLGIHTELGWPGLAKMWRDGIVDGSQKEIHRHKSVAAAWTGIDPEDIEIIADNPHFELYDPEYVLSSRTLARLDRFVSINNAISVDLLGQINAETVFGGRIINGTGGQPEMHIAGAQSPGGRAITLLPSTAMGGAVSRIVSQLESGSYVTIPRYFADYVITEYGIARLLGKNHRERAEELIAVAHPDHRDTLRAEARALWWP